MRSKLAKRSRSCGTVSGRLPTYAGRATTTVLALVIGAAFAHAAWNFLAKGAEGGVGFVWLSSLVATLLWVPVLVFAEAET